MIRRFIGFLFLLGIIGGLVWYYGFRPVGDVVITGIVTTDDVIVSSQVVGRIKQLHVKEGDIVKKGEPIATIEKDEWEKQMAYYTQAARGLTPTQSSLLLVPVNGDADSGSV